MTTVRLEDEVVRKLEQIARRERRSKSEVIKTALSEYFTHHSEESTPYQLGEDLFGQFGSGEQERSVTYKQRLKGKLGGKHAH